MSGASETAPVKAYLFGRFRLEVDAHRLTRDGDVLLTGKACETLLALVKHRDRIVEKDELIRLVWPDAFVTDDSLTQSISMLRRALGDDSAQPHYIATIPRRGYRFLAAVTPVLEAPTASTRHALAGDAVSPAHEGVPALGARGAPVAGPTAVRWGSPILWLGLAAGIALLVAWAPSIDVARTVPIEQPIWFQQEAPAGTTLASGGVLSPNGRYLAFVVRHVQDGKTRLWVRPLDSATARPLTGTEGTFRPFWSPDSQSLAFFANGWLKRAGLDGAPPQTLTAVGYRPSGGAWSSTGAILYADRMSRLYLVKDSGESAATPVTTLDPSRHEVAHMAPQFLPDGRHFLYFVDSTKPEYTGTFAGSLDSPARIPILDQISTSVTFAPPDQLIYVRDRVVMVQPFDPVRLRTSGSAAALGGVSMRSDTMSAASNLLAFGGEATGHHLAWFDRQGRPVGSVDESVDLHNPVISPDQRQLLGDRDGLWLVDLEQGAPTKLGDGNLPVWSPGGAGIVFTSRRVPDAVDLYLRPIAGRPEDERLLVRSKEMKLSGDWSGDGRYFVYVSSDPETRLDIWILPTFGDRVPRPFLRTPTNEMQPKISPDGAWIVYTSDETGNWEVYVQSFPDGGAKRAISVGGGAEPQWTKGGREIVYVTPDGAMTAVDVLPGEALRASRPAVLFRVPLSGDITRYRNHYAATADGQRFLVDTADESTREPINVVVNWEALVGR